MKEIITAFVQTPAYLIFIQECKKYNFTLLKRDYRLRVNRDFFSCGVTILLIHVKGRQKNDLKLLLLKSEFRLLQVH